MRVTTDQVERAAVASLRPLFPGAKPAGEGKWLARCFEHDDESASLYLTLNKHGWRYHCFVCGADGNAINVLVKRDRKTFQEAVVWLCEASVGLPIAPYRAPMKWLAVCNGCGAQAKVRNLEHLVSLTDAGRTLGAWRVSRGGTVCVCPSCVEAYERDYGSRGGQFH